MKTLEPRTSPQWRWPESSASIEFLPTTTWDPHVPGTEAKGGIYVLRRRYLRSEREVEETFERLAASWERDTLLVSSPSEAAMHDSYQKIIGLGLQVVPLLLQRLRDTRRNYFWALNAITHRDPAERSETVGEAIDAWLAWGSDNGYIDP